MPRSWGGDRPGAGRKTRVEKLRQSNPRDQRSVASFFPTANVANAEAISDEEGSAAEDENVSDGERADQRSSDEEGGAAEDGSVNDASDNDIAAAGAPVPAPGAADLAPNTSIKDAYLAIVRRRLVENVMGTTAVVRPRDHLRLRWFLTISHCLDVCLYLFSDAIAVGFLFAQ